LGTREWFATWFVFPVEVKMRICRTEAQFLIQSISTTYPASPRQHFPPASSRHLALFHHRLRSAERAMATLPEDLHYVIASYFEYDIPNLRVLNRVSRAFHRASRELLYRHLGAVLPQNGPRLLRSVDENPDVAALITSWFLSFDLHDANGVISELIRVLVFPNMRKLEFERSDKFYRTPYIPGGIHTIFTRRKQLNEGRPADKDFECSFLDNEEHDLQNIRAIELKNDFTTTELLRFMLLLSVQTLRATSLSIMRSPRLTAAWSKRRVNIIRLELRGSWLSSISPSTIHTILLYCPQLRILHMTILMINELRGVGTEVSSSVTQPVSPAALQRMLVPVQEKNLRGNWQCSMKGEGPAFLSQVSTSIPPARYDWVLQLLSPAPPSLTGIEMVDPPGREQYVY
jgi:hypothetical protein